MDIGDREKLIKAYDHMVEQVHQAVHEAEEALAPTVDEMVHNAQQLAREVYALTQEEAESLGNSLRRDLHKADQALNREGKELKDWLSFDLSLVEDRFLELVSRAADKTWLDLRKFEYEDHQASLYRSGEISSAGTFSCSNCNHRVPLERSGAIPRCPQCDHDEFFRVIA